mmetsp:Transcript_24266/g.53412  ORF Transcript_24266/g.53412 Transcript_24266/m.53412 type:complete len:89 (-) Transcript_24266:185-451(-)|eukprot:CAMPEP_0204301486 /NCGR_PEP_ID=MMETSP0468-20130131/80462_1 /ASSEMBLY_ACC=CAM_ASM_000383 /TAXON_ID=2969 /ORGANISM="Oxyrrhis marina" /LENGTH=88 /DNA_ID=CAMNT_0051280631 /DNA_START=228 /DNA_END=494 /DNA_ORIENTATION=+
MSLTSLLFFQSLERYLAFRHSIKNRLTATEATDNNFLQSFRLLDGIKEELPGMICEVQAIETEALQNLSMSDAMTETLHSNGADMTNE